MQLKSTIPFFRPVLKAYSSRAKIPVLFVRFKHNPSSFFLFNSLSFSLSLSLALSFSLSFLSYSLSSSISEQDHQESERRSCISRYRQEAFLPEGGRRVRVRGPPDSPQAHSHVCATYLCFNVGDARSPRRCPFEIEHARKKNPTKHSKADFCFSSKCHAINAHPFSFYLCIVFILCIVF